MWSNQDKASDHGPAQRPDSDACATRLRSADLFRRGNRLIIEHRGREYCLRLTRNDKLILTGQ
ncbi:MAG: hemin uptake protein HemP [Salinisphaera sp.]|nr:hemin uptake protein HemP [Salinisphaera sp.]